MKTTDVPSGSPKPRAVKAGQKHHKLDLPLLWHAYELDEIAEDAWSQAYDLAYDGTGSAEVRAARDALWLAPDERAQLEAELAVGDILERSERFLQLRQPDWRTAFAGEIEAFSSGFGVVGTDPHLEDWLNNRMGELWEQARVNVEKDYQRTHPGQRHWLRNLREDPGYRDLIEQKLAAYRLPNERGTLAPQLDQAYRMAMAQRCDELMRDFSHTIKAPLRARKTLELHEQLAERYPAGCDALHALGGADAYADRLANELVQKARDDDFLLSVHGKRGFMRTSNTSLDAMRRVIEDAESWQRSIERTLKRGKDKNTAAPLFAERVYLDLIDADPQLGQLVRSPIGFAASAYVRDQLLASRIGEVEDALAQRFAPADFIDALGSSEHPALCAMHRDFADYARSEHARREALRRAYAEAAASANADPYLGYPAHRTHPRTVVVHVGPTNAGKTHAALEAFNHAERAVYLGPLRLLAAEVADGANEAGIACSLLTGEERRLVEGATHTAATVEMFDPTLSWDVAVIDEAQMVGDLDRGGAWSRALIGLDVNELHVCCAPEGLQIVGRVLEGCSERFGDQCRVEKHRRLNPLEAQAERVRFPHDVLPGDAVVVFSKKDVHAAAAELHAAGMDCCVVYGALPHTVRRDEARRFREGDAQVVVATDAIGMGLNLPVKRVVFLRHDKYDGRGRRELTSTEVKQIAGRAGRYGYAEAGLVASAIDPGFIEDALFAKERPVRTATLAFPKTLLEIGAPASMLFDAWSNTRAPAPFRCADYSEEAMLAERAEAVTSDVATVYAFAMLPFKSRDERVMDLWEAILRAHVAGTAFPEFNKGWLTDDLDSMQVTYDKLDLVYSYLMGPGSGCEIDPDDVAELREHVSRDISELLATQSYESRTCSRCGRPLPWNHRFGLCDQCAGKRSFDRREGRPSGGRNGGSAGRRPGAGGGRGRGGRR